MQLTKFIEKLQAIQQEHGDIDVCYPCAAWDNYVLVQESDISVPPDVVALNDDQDIAEGYDVKNEQGNLIGKPAVIIGNL